jgi:hypothetical protein
VPGSGNLGFRIALAVPHAAARRGGAPGNEADHGLFAPALRLVFAELCRIFLGGAADLAD